MSFDDAPSVDIARQPLARQSLTMVSLMNSIKVLELLFRATLFI
jgi:hypothetical protein